MAQADIATEKTSVDDRLLVMLLLAGLFHLILILGISFSAPSLSNDGSTSTLEVLLVSDALPESLKNDQARYLSQRTQQGAGNMQDSTRSQMPTPSNSPVDQDGDAQGMSAQEARAGLAGGDADAITSRGAAPRMTFSADAEHPMEQSTDAARQLVAGADTNLPSSDDDPELRLKGRSRPELMVAASTRESNVAVYLDAWRRKVERVGTLNFPNQARRRGMSGNPTVAVALTSDGQLAEVRIQKSSGYAELDQAAMEILRLAAPFEPFSREMARQHEILRFAYEWQFVSGELSGSTLRVPATIR
jgi:protein TonB